MDKIMAIIPAAGASKRMGTGVNKQLLSLNGRAVLEHTIRAISAANCITGIILAVKPGEESYFKNWLNQLFGEIIRAVVPGGAERQESVGNCLEVVPADTEIVLVHDGARPLVEPSLVEKVVETAKAEGAATLGVPVKDTVKMMGEDNRVIKTIPRDKLWLVQTPQAFRYHIIYEAHKWASARDFYGTDDASLVEAMGHPVAMVRGSYANIKITTPEDMIIAEALMRTRLKGS